MQFLILCVHVVIIRDRSRRRTLDREMSEGPAQMKWLHTRCVSDCVGYNYLQKSLVEVKVDGSFLLIMFNTNSRITTRPFPTMLAYFRA